MYRVEAAQLVELQLAGRVKQGVVERDQIETDQDAACAVSCCGAFTHNGPQDLDAREGAGREPNTTEQEPPQRIGLRLADDQLHDR